MAMPQRANLRPMSQEAIVPLAQPELVQLLFCGLLCNDAILQKEQGEWVILGDPTEGALVVLAGKGGLNQQQLLQPV
jgi:Ca2+-transporting ATPase